MYSLIIVNIWKAAGYYLFKITLPILSPTLFFLTLTAIINSFKVFETVNVMTKGGPLDSTTTLVYYIYQYRFEYYKIGYASAVGVVLMIIVSTLTIVYFCGLQKKVHYQ